MSQATQKVKELLALMGVEPSRVEEREVGDRIKVDIILKEARMLIGERGITLAMFQHIVRRIAAKEAERSGSGGMHGAGRSKVSSDSFPDLPEVDLGFLDTKNNAPASAYKIIDIDINGYKRMREELLRDFAMDIAKSVREKRKSVELEPMPPFDRRIVHLTLANLSDVTSESMGEGEHRYIVVRPYP